MIIKVEATNIELIEYQINLTKKILGVDYPISLHLAGDLSPKLLDESPLISLMNRLESVNVINDIFFSPVYSDSDAYANLEKYDNFGWALNYSLIEREFTESFFQKSIVNNKAKTLALGSFGEGVDGYGNWNYPMFVAQKSASYISDHRDAHNKMCSEINMSNIDTRLTYTLKNPNLDYSVMTFSNSSQLKKALNIAESIVDREKYKLLDDFSKKYSNFGRNNLGTVQRIHLNSFYIHPLYRSTLVSIQTGTFLVLAKNMHKRIYPYIVRLYLYLRGKVSAR